MADIGKHLGRRGIAARGLHTTSATGDAAPMTATTGTDTTPATTETYIAEVFIPHNQTVTGVSILNGSAAAGNVTVILYDENGKVLGTSASTAQSGTAAYQAIPLATAVNAVGPAQHFVGVQFSSTSARFRTHTVGVFPASKTTGGTYGTVPAITTPTTFTTAVGPIASVY